MAADGGDDAQAKKSKKGKAKDREATNAAEATNSGLRNFGQMIPQGSRSRGVRIPAFDGTGKPSSLIVADAMTRIDDTQLFCEKMVIQVFAAKKEEDMRIDLKTGTYNMDEQMLTSEDRSRVSRPDFQIEGNSMVYDTKTGQGKMVGNVEMIIYDADSAKAKMTVNPAGAKTESAGEKPKASTPDGAPSTPTASPSQTGSPTAKTPGGEQPIATPAAASPAKKTKTKKKK